MTEQTSAKRTRRSPAERAQYEAEQVAKQEESLKKRLADLEVFKKAQAIGKASHALQTLRTVPTAVQAKPEFAAAVKALEAFQASIK